VFALLGICRADPSEVRVGSEVDFRPYAFVDNDGKPTGFSVDLIAAVANAMGLQIRITTGSWDEVWNRLQTGAIDVLPIAAALPDRQQVVDFSVPHTETYDAFFVREGRPVFADLAAARGREIVVMRSDAAHHALEERHFDGKMFFVNTVPEGLALVGAGKHDAFLCSKLIGALEIRAHHISGLYSGPPLPDYKRVFSFAVQKGNHELLEKLNQGLLIIKANGEYDRIYRHWLALDDPWRWLEPYIQPAIVFIIALGSIVVFIIVILQWLVKKRTRELARANDSIQELNRGLEGRVAERTAELRSANASMEKSRIAALKLMEDAVLARREAERVNDALRDEIAERKRAEEEVRESEGRLRMQRERMPIGCIVFDRQFRFSQMNPAAEGIFGYSESELQGKLSSVIVPESTRAHVDDILRRLGKGDMTAHSVNENVTRDGRIILCEWTNTPLLDANGTIFGFLSMVQDITARHQAEQALRRLTGELEQRVEERTRELARATENVQAERLRLNEMLGRLPVYIILLSKDYRVTFANRFFEERFGRDADKRCFEYLFGRTEPCENCETFKVFSTNAPHRWEWLGPDGRNYDIYDFPFIDVDGTYLVMEVGLDVSERKKAAAEVLAERQRLFDVLETLPSMICLLTKDYHIAFANRGFRERFGESNGRRCYEYCFGNTEPCDFCECFRVFETGLPHHWEFSLQDGRVLDAHDFPFTDADGSPLILEMLIDITDQRRAQQELRQAHEELGARANQLRALAGELTLSEQRERSRLARILHDHLQQLLVAAKFRVTILGRGGDDIVKQGSKEVEELINESITASRSLTAELSPPILHDAGLKAGLQWLARRMGDTQGLLVELEMEEDGNLPQDIKVLLFESVRELLFNAAKHAHTRSATVNLRRIQDHLQVVVADQGAGFDPAAMPAAGEGGRGFGLFSIRERIALMGGTMSVESRPGYGSRFVLSLPITSSMQTMAVRTPESTRSRETKAMPSRHEDPGRKIRVLLADDHAVVRQGMANLLGDEPDMEVVGEAGDGQEAVHLAAKLLPDVILMDMSMPKLNGVEATRLIHHDWPGISIIGLSMFEEAERAKAMRDAGAVSYLTKSGPANELINVIRSSIRTSSTDNPHA
jgi:PAS domain S-box-containing protein